MGLGTGLHNVRCPCTLHVMRTTMKNMPQGNLPVRIKIQTDTDDTTDEVDLTATSKIIPDSTS